MGSPRAARMWLLLASWLSSGTATAVVVLMSEASSRAWIWGMQTGVAVTALAARERARRMVVVTMVAFWRGGGGGVITREESVYSV